MWKFTNWSTNSKRIVTAVVILLFTWFTVLVYNAPPTIHVEGVNYDAITRTDEDKYVIKGNISSFHDATLTINGTVVPVDGYGDYQYTLTLEEGDNKITIVATSEKGTNIQKFVIHRTTKAEFAERERLASEKKAKQEAEKAKNSSNSSQSGVLYDVVRVVDGDTIDVNIDGKVERLRLIGMDTPETVDPRKPVQCFGKEASAKAKELLSGKKVRLEKDDSQGNRDKYDRLLRYVFLEDGTSFNKKMIAMGYAHEYTYNLPYKYQSEYKQAQKDAEKAGKGLWSPSTCNGDTDQSATPSAQTTPKSQQSTAPTNGNCDPNYSPCVPSVSYDLDCGDISFSVKVIGTDHHRFDRDGDGYGCESN